MRAVSAAQETLGPKPVIVPSLGTDVQHHCRTPPPPPRGAPVSLLGVCACAQPCPHVDRLHVPSMAKVRGMKDRPGRSAALWSASKFGLNYFRVFLEVFHPRLVLKLFPKLSRSQASCL